MKSPTLFVVGSLEDDELWLDAMNSPDNASKLLARVADYLESHEPVPTHLARFVARAFRAAAETGPDFRATKLCYHLGLTGAHKRPAVSTIRVGEFIRAAKSNNPQLSQTKAVAAAAKHFNVGITTIRDHWKIYETARRVAD